MAGELAKFLLIGSDQQRYRVNHNLLPKVFVIQIFVVL